MYNKPCIDCSGSLPELLGLLKAGADQFRGNGCLANAWKYHKTFGLKLTSFHMHLHGSWAAGVTSWGSMCCVPTSHASCSYQQVAQDGQGIQHLA